MHANEKDFSAASTILSGGADFAHLHEAHYTRILFLLSKGMMLMIERKLAEVHPVLSLAGQLVESWQGNGQQKESLKVFFLVLQVCHHLNTGQVRIKLLNQIVLMVKL